MVEDPHTEAAPKDIVWLSPNCCDLTPATQRQEPQAPVSSSSPPVPPRSRLLGLLKGKSRS